MASDGSADGGGGETVDASYERALKALGTLISGKKRSDGKSWSAAFDNMER